jgi:hypothetical protein
MYRWKHHPKSLLLEPPSIFTNLQFPHYLILRNGHSNLTNRLKGVKNQNSLRAMNETMDHVPRSRHPHMQRGRGVHCGSSMKQLLQQTNVVNFLNYFERGEIMDNSLFLSSGP